MDNKLLIERRILREFVERVHRRRNDINLATEAHLILAQLKNKGDRLKHLNESIAFFVAEGDYEEELHECEVFTDMIIELEAQLSVSQSKSAFATKERRFKLPELQIIPFDGEAQNWLQFWAHFKKIYEDDGITDEDKLLYLIQSTTGKAKSLVSSFPPSGENFNNAFDSLKNRFARDEVIVEYYVRQILNIMISQLNSKNLLPLCELYDKLMIQINALESLNMTSDSYAAMLLPMVESSLPRETLIQWERVKALGPLSGSVRSSTSLTGCGFKELLDFLRREVDGQERVRVAQNSCNDKFETFATASALINKSEREPSTLINKSEREPNAFINKAERDHKFTLMTCIFCSKGHASHECKKAVYMSYKEKIDCVTENNACFSCLKRFHSSKNCRYPPKCYVCHRLHHVVICPELEKRSAETKETNRPPREDMMTTTNSCYNNSHEVFMQTAVVEVSNPCDITNKIKVRVLFDSGSQRSYILSSLAAKLTLKAQKISVVKHQLFGGIENKVTHRTHRVLLKSLFKEFSMEVDVLTQDKICNTVGRFSDESIIRELRARNIVLADTADVHADEEIGLLLGADILGSVLTGAVERGNTLSYIETEFGWTVMGSSDSSSYLNIGTSHSLFVGKLWDLEVIGIEDPIKIETRLEHNDQVLHDFQNSIQKLGDRYTVKLPWAVEPTDLESNKGLALAKLKATTDKLRKIDKLNPYDCELRNWLSQGIIEEINSPNERAHYLPHRPVFKENSSTTKIRPVFDASCKTPGGRCLNDFLEKGPNLMEVIPNLVIKFRMGAIGVTSDVKKAFLQIAVDETDRDKLRFLWYKDATCTSIQEFRHTRVVFGLSCSPFLLMATLDYHLKNIKDCEANIDVLRKSFYVDNSLTAFDEISEYYEFMVQSKKVMSAAQFELREWAHTLKPDPFPCCLTGECIMQNNENKVVNILGLLWEPKTDTLFCNLKFVSECAPDVVNKRFLLSMIQKFYDPLGYLNPFLLCPKLLLQETWKLKVSWEESLPPDLCKKFINWLNQMKELPTIAIDRCCTLGASPAIYELHTFCDASQEAYGCCIFLRCEGNNGIEVKFLMSRARIRPLKDTATIPRMELLACVLGSRLAASIEQTLSSKISFTKFFWTDSMVSLNWIQSDKILPLFVKNRVTGILSQSKTEEWNHIQGVRNIADVLTRETSLDNILASKWWLGPKWLHEPKEKWSVKPRLSIDNNLLNKSDEGVFGDLSLANEFPSFFKTAQILGWILKFVRKCREKKRTRGSNIQHQGGASSAYLTFRDYSDGKTRLIKLIQQECLDPSKLANMVTFHDRDGLVRIRTKLVLNEFTDDFKSPVVLESSSRLVKCLIREVHELNNHTGVGTLMTILRQDYWIVKSRQACKVIVNKCVTCRRFSAKPVSRPEAPLPIGRTQLSTAFQSSGVDLAGPLHLKDGTKTWLVLFSCCVYRAIHLELTSSLSTDSFLMALRRFVARRGRVETVYCDNGTNFRGAFNILSEIDWNKVQSRSFNKLKPINWQFNPPSAPWWGGHYERLIRTIKDLLKRVLGNAKLSLEELNTVICDVEATVNSRPLTYVSEVPGELEPLTPAHFLSIVKIHENPDMDTIDEASLNMRLKYMQELRFQLRSRFKDEYLGFLTHRATNMRKRHELQIGDVVLIASDNTKRQTWPLGLILEFLPGSDSVNRVVKVKTETGEYLRPIQRLVPLEVSRAETTDLVEDVTKTHPQLFSPIIDNNSDSATPDVFVPLDDSDSVSLPDEERRSRRGRKIIIPARLRD